MSAPATGKPARHVKCPGCKAGLRFKGDPAGKKVKCPKCSHQWVVVDVPPELSAAALKPIMEGPPRGESGPVQPVTGSVEAIDPWVGKTLGQFQVVRLLGKGGMGAVYEAMDSVLQRFVALKVVPPQVSDDPKTLERFLREARAACQISHPNLVGVYQVGQSQGVTFIVMQIVRGGNCSEWVRQRGPMTAAQASWITAEAARGLNAAHTQGIIHRDIKPSNLMLDENGSVKVADFGLAKSFDIMDVGLTTPGEVVGTPSYMSPEQCRGDGLGPQSDLYSLGATYFFLLTGRPPYQAENPTGIMFKHVYEPIPDPRTERPDLPEGCWQVILRSMAKEPSVRYQTGEEMAAELAAVEAGTGAEAFAGAGGGVEVVDFPVFDPPAGSSGGFAGGGRLAAFRAGRNSETGTGTVARLIRHNPTAMYGVLGAVAAVLIVVLIFALRGGERNLPPRPRVEPGAGGTGTGSADVNVKVGGTDGSGSGTSGTSGSGGTHEERMTRLRLRLDRLKDRGRTAEGKELDTVIAELKQFAKDRLTGATTSEELELGRTANGEVDRLTFARLEPLPPAKFEPSPKFGPEPVLLAPGTVVPLFDGRVDSRMQMTGGWIPTPADLVFEPRGTERGGIWINVGEVADFEMTFKIHWEEPAVKSHDLSVHYRMRPNGAFGFCFAPSHAQINRLGQKSTTLDRVRELPVPGQWYEVALRVKGRSHRALVDGKIAAQTETDDVGGGRIHVTAHGGRLSIRDWKLTVSPRD